MDLPFTKCEGAGNDFLVLEGAPPKFGLRSEASLRKFVQKTCDRHFGVGADGCVFLWARGSAAHQMEQDWIWEFRNADGSRAEMCGNAARALALWFHQRFPREHDFAWEARAGLIRARLDARGAPWVQWPGKAALREVQGLPKTRDFRLTIAQAGVPHAVCFSEKTWTPEARARWAAELRHHRRLGRAGANVTFVSRRTRETVTFERGVEGETLACGSGAVAAFLTEESRTPKLKEARYRFPGGNLIVKRDTAGLLWLTGPAKLVFKGTLA